jgi:hypothetical protein
MELSFPALAHRVTVLGSTRNIAATSAGVSKGSDSGGRAFTAASSVLPHGPWRTVANGAWSDLSDRGDRFDPMLPHGWNEAVILVKGYPTGQDPAELLNEKYVTT